MKGYSSTEVFTEDEIMLLRKATALVYSLPDIPELRCHELARGVGKVLGLQVQDGYYGFVNHSWLWTSVPDEHFSSETIRWRCPRILDVYCVGSLPQVRLLDTSSSLPHAGWNYRPGDPRTDIQEDVVEVLVALMKDHPVHILYPRY